MQDLIFYVAANQPLGVFKDFENSIAVADPTLVRGVPVRLCVRLFATQDGPTAYPIDAFSSVRSWSFVMDTDYDSGTTVKIESDPNGISVETVTDTIDGIECSFTEVKISISNMNSVQLASLMYGKECVILTGQLIGSDENEQPVFALQMRGFHVRNRVDELWGDDPGSGGSGTIKPLASYDSYGFVKVVSGGGILVENGEISVDSSIISGGGEIPDDLVNSETMSEAISSAVNSAGHITQTELETYLSTTSGGYATLDYLNTTDGGYVTVNYLNDVLSNFVQLYGLTPVQVVKYAAPTITTNITSATNSDVILTASYVEQVTSKEYSTNNVNWLTYPVGGVTVSENGVRYFRGMDENGDLTSTGSYEVANIDKVPPTAPVPSANITTATNQNVIVTATFSDDSVVKEYKIGDGNWTTYTNGGVTMTANETVTFRAKDEAGNISSESYVVSNIDKAAPVLTLNYDNTGSVQSGVISATVDDGSAIQYKIPGGNWISYPVNGATVTANGTYEFKATDAAGNVGSGSVVISNIDRTAPVITLYGNAASTTPTTVYASTESGLAIYWRKGNSGSWNTYTNGVSVTTNGTYNFKATDAAGNTGTASITFSNIQAGDTTPPVISLSYDNVTENLQSDTLTATTDEPATITYSIDDGTTWSAYPSGGITVTENGTYMFQAVDASGNVGTASVTYDNIARGHETDPGQEDEED